MCLKHPIVPESKEVLIHSQINIHNDEGMSEEHRKQLIKLPMAKDEQQNKITLNYSNNYFLITVIIIIIIPGFTSITLLNGHMQATTSQE